MNWTFLDITSLGNNNQLNLKNNEFKLLKFYFEKFNQLEVRISKLTFPNQTLNQRMQSIKFSEPIDSNNSTKQ